MRSLLLLAPQIRTPGQVRFAYNAKKIGDRIVSDVLRVVQGETTLGKVLKGGSLFIVDVCTFGLSEIVATPVTDRKDDLRSPV